MHHYLTHNMFSSTFKTRSLPATGIQFRGSYDLTARVEDTCIMASQSTPPRNKGVIAGLAKGNQLLIGPINTALLPEKYLMAGGWLTSHEYMATTLRRLWGALSNSLGYAGGTLSSERRRNSGISLPIVSPEIAIFGSAWGLLTHRMNAGNNIPRLSNICHKLS